MIAPASRKIGKYEIRHKLGRGGMADVYLAQDTALGYSVALKLIEESPDQDTRDAIAAERRGAVLQAHLAAVDPRVVRVYDSGDLEGYFFVAMEYIDGQDLSEVMRRGKLEVEFATDVALAVARTLESAHTLQVAIAGKDYCGVVHGDIKPKNIRIDSHSEVRVLDFGIAKALSLSRKLTRNEFGSVPYASPERLDLGEVSAASDLWSLAVMLYEMVTGVQPYQAVSTERLEGMIRSRIAPPPAPDPCPEPLRRILIKAMAPDPEMRYSSAQEFREDLEAFRSGGVIGAMQEDLDSTRRTWRAAEAAVAGAAADGASAATTRSRGFRPGPPQGATPSAGGPDDTRRTAAKASVAGRPAQAKQRGGAFYGAMRVLAALVLGAVLYGVAAVVGDCLLYSHGQELARQIETEQLTDPDQIWTKWTELSKNNPTGLLLRGPRKLVKEKLVAAADHVIDTYRNSEAQPVYEKDWERARTMAARALAVEPDNSVRGKLRLCEGHISRINGVSHKNSQELNSAVDEFGEAQRLMPKSPDPELGLARLYVYGLKDIDKAYEALQEAQKRGYQLGNREKSQLADGYLARADRVWWDSRNVRGLPQEKDQIQRAADDYKRALELYQGIAPFGNANAGIVRVQNSLDSVNFRLQQIASGASAAAGQSGAERESGPGEFLRREILRRILRSSKLIEQWQ